MAQPPPAAPPSASPYAGSPQPGLFPPYSYPPYALAQAYPPQLQQQQHSHSTSTTYGYPAAAWSTSPAGGGAEQPRAIPVPYFMDEPPPAAAVSAPAPAPARPADEWAREWMARHGRQQSQGQEGQVWTRSALRARLQRLTASLAELEELRAAGPAAVAGMEGQAERGLALCGELRRELGALGDRLALEQFKAKELKRQKKERWLARKVERVRASREQAESGRRVMETLIGEWQRVYKATEEEKKRAKDARREQTRQAARAKEQARRDEEFNQLLCKLELLRSLRRRRDRGSGPTAGDEGGAVDAALRDFYAQLERKAAPPAPAPSPAPLDTPAATAAAAAAAAAAGGVAGGEQTLQYWESFYNAANQSLDALLDVRRRWDAHLTREGAQGSCVPPYFLDPPRPASAWRPFLLYTSERAAGGKAAGAKAATG